MMIFSLVSAIALLSTQLRGVYARSNITFYSDAECQTLIGSKTGPDDGDCTIFPENVAGYLSFMVTSLDQTCEGE